MQHKILPQILAKNLICLRLKIICLRVRKVTEEGDGSGVGSGSAPKCHGTPTLHFSIGKSSIIKRKDLHMGRKCLTGRHREAGRWGSGCTPDGTTAGSRCTAASSCTYATAQVVKSILFNLDIKYRNWRGVTNLSFLAHKNCQTVEDFNKNKLFSLISGFQVNL